MARKTKRGAGTATAAARLQERLAIEHGTTHALADSANLVEAAPRIIRAVCETLGWDCGACWTPSGDHVHCIGRWGVDDAAVQAFLARSPAIPLPTTPKGLMRRAWVGRGPVWVRDVTADDSFRRAPHARKAGLRAAFAFPIIASERVIGAFEFFSHKVRAPDAELLDCTRYMSSQIGQFVQRTEAQRALRESEERFRSTFELAASGITHVDSVSGRLLMVNRSVCEMLGYREDELLGRTVKELSHPDDRDVTDEPRRRVQSGELAAARVEKRYMHKDGHPVWVSLAVAPVRGADGKPLYDIAILNDITQRKQTEELQRMEHAVTRELAEAATLGGAIGNVMRIVCGSQGWQCAEYWALDDKSHVLRFGGFWSSLSPELNQMFERAHEYVFSPGEGLVGRAWESGAPLWVEDVMADGRMKRKELARDAGVRGAFVFPLATAGENIGVLSFWSREIRAPDARLLEAVRVIGSQIAQFVRRKKAEERIQYFATHDGLTGLPNRDMFGQLLGTAIESGRRYQHQFALLFIDLDGFKEINDSRGHDTGDEVLREIAKRLRSSLRASDLVGRLGGDEFVALIHAAAGDEPVIAVAKKILGALPNPVAVESGGACAVTASIGVAVFPRHGTDPSTLMRAADQAMYAAKQGGKNTYKFAG